MILNVLSAGTSKVLSHNWTGFSKFDIPYTQTVGLTGNKKM
jgi:hypothetical protein